MRRRQIPPEPPEAPTTDETPTTCSSCGSHRRPSALRCTICGQPFTATVDVTDLWRSVGSTPATDEVRRDLYASQDGERLSSPGDLDAPADDIDRVDLASDRRPPSGAVRDPWAASAGTLGTLPGKPDSGNFIPPSSGAATPPAGRSRLRTTLLTILAILAVAGTAAWFGARPYVNRQIVDNVGAAIDDELDGIAALPVDDAGQIRIVEGDISRALRTNAAAYEPVTSPRVSLSRNGIRIVFTLYGAEHTLTGKLAVERGRVVLNEPLLSGPLERVIDLDEVVASSEESIADLFARRDTRPVSLKTSDDTLVITVERV